MRLVFIGTSEFACPALAALQGGHEIALVVTQPDRPVGRHAILTPPPVKKEAIRLRLPVFQPEKVNSPEALARIRRARPDAIVVAAYGQILKPELIEIPHLGTINIHASLLPRYRGAAPINWAIINGETETGITTFLIDPGMDTGPILMQRKTEIGPDETAGELHNRLAAIGAELIVETLDRLVSGEITPIPQDDSKSTLAPRLSREDGRIDWVRPAREVHNLIRGTNPWPGAFTRLSGKRVKIHRSRRTGIKRGDHLPGEIALRETGRLLVATSDELLELLELQREGRPRVSGLEFLNGLRGETRFN